MELIKKLPPTIKRAVKRLPDVKPHLDLIAAGLTIPVLVTAVLLNFGNLQTKLTGQTLAPTPTSQIPRVIDNTASQVKITSMPSTPQATNSATCQAGIGNISIASPLEGQNITNNPVCININYQSGNYCSVVWAYRVNGGPLSDYGNNSVCLYNLSPGKTIVELDVKSLVNTNTQTLIRTFTVVGAVTTPTPTDIPTPTILLTPTPTKSS
jgi:hypothetical protein